MYNVLLECKVVREMRVEATSVKEARECAAIQLAKMGWSEYRIDSAWEVDHYAG